MPPPTLEQARREFARILEGLDHPPLGMAAALAEECGEVARLLLDRHAYGKPLEKTRLAGELMDVFVCLCEIATSAGVDMDAAVAAKLHDLGERAPAWRVELAEALRKARGGEGGSGGCA